MPLSSAVSRQPLHTRQLIMKGFRRDDGLFDIEGVLIDTKPHDIPNEDRGGKIAQGESLHEMHVRLTINHHMDVIEAQATTEWAPFNFCSGGTKNFHKLVGANVGPGWNRKVRAVIGGKEGCTHINELLAQMATVAFQSIWGDKDKAMSESNEKPGILDTCHALASDSPVVKQHWSKFYTGDD